MSSQELAYRDLENIHYYMRSKELPVFSEQEILALNKSVGIIYARLEKSPLPYTDMERKINKLKKQFRENDLMVNDYVPHTLERHARERNDHVLCISIGGQETFDSFCYVLASRLPK